MKLLRRYFANIFLLVTIGIFTSLLILAGAVYLSVRTNLLRLMYEAETRTLDQTTYSAKLMTDYVIQIALQLFSDEAVHQALNTAIFSEAEQLRIKNRLDSIANSTAFIQSIYVYNNRIDKIFVGSPLYTLYPVYSSAEFFDGGIIDILEKPTQIRGHVPIVRTFTMPSYSYYQKTDTVTANVHSFIFREIPWSKQALVINVDRTWIEQTITEIDKNTINRTLIVQKKDARIVADSSRHQADRSFLQSAHNSEFYNGILSHGNPSGYFLIDINGMKNLVVYLNFSQLDWYFIRIIPFGNLMARTKQLIQNILIISAIILTFGLFLSFLISRRLYLPFYTTLSRLVKLEEEHTSSQMLFKDDFIRNTILKQSYREPHLADSSPDGTCLEIDMTRPLQLLLIIIDDYHSFCCRISHDRRSKIKNDIREIASREIRPFSPCEALDMQDKNIVVIFNPIIAAAVDTESRFKDVVKTISAHASECYQISLSYALSRTTDNSSELHLIYNHCVEASMRKVYMGYGCFIMADSIPEKSEEQFRHPFHAEKHLIEDLFNGHLTDARLHFLDIIDASCKFPYSVFLTTMVHLVLSINTALQDAAEYSFIQFETNVHVFIDTLNRLDHLDAIKAHFDNLFRQIVLHINQRKERKHAALIDQVLDFIKQQYANPNLSLEMISEDVHLSSGHLSQIFRAHTGQSIPDAIRSIRLEHAIKLMCDTDGNLQTISAQAGFMNTPYFYKAFKKHYGVTPSDYRMKLSTR
jgi:AraC-like DNA-binding protein